jgi:hypothetical protein
MVTYSQVVEAFFAATDSYGLPAPDSGCGDA